MAKNRTSKYQIELEIKQGDDVRSTIDSIERSLKSITDSAKSGDLSKGLADSRKQAEQLAEQIKSIASSEKDSTQEIEAYSKAASKAIADLEKQNSLITYSLSEQGKEQRARIAELKQELSVLGQTKAEKQKAKDIQKELKQLQKEVLDYSDEDLKKAQATNRATRTALKMAQQEAKIKQAEVKNNKTLGQLIKADIKSLQEKIKAQLKFVDALKTTEGRYNLIKKAAEKAGKAGLAIGKTALKAGGALVGGAMALGGAAIASANSQVDREREANRIKGGMSKDDKQALLGELYVQSGADYTSIVDAINRVSTVLGTGLSKDELVQATTAELRYPGAAAMFRQQNTEAPTATNFMQYQNRMQAIQGATGASVDQVTASTEKIANMRQSSFSNASMTDLQSVYLGLQNSGAFDSQDELDRAFSRFVRSQKNSKDNVFEHAQKFDWVKTAYGATNKTQAMNALANMDWGRLETAAKTDSSEIQLTEAEKTAKKMREMEEVKNRILIKMLEAISPIFERVDVKELEKVFNAMFDFFSEIAPDIQKFLTKASEWLQEIIGYLQKAAESLFDTLFAESPQVQGAGMQVTKNADGTQRVITASSAINPRGGWFSEGSSMVTMPSICGEAGPEAVIPLDYSRRARGIELTQQVSQYFNMSSSETSVLSLAQAVKSREFTNAINHNAYMSQRLGR